MGSLEKSFLKNQILAKLPRDEFNRLLPHLEPVNLSSGEVLYEIDQAIEHIYFHSTQ